MKEIPPLIPDASQTVGPYFRIGLEYLIDLEPKLEREEADVFELSGRVLDANAAPVHDAMLEFWSPLIASEQLGYPGGFHRVVTDEEGRYRVLLRKPDALLYPGGGRQAPHVLVLVFCRGLLRNLVTRVYFAQEPANNADPILLSLHPERRPTLIAQRDRGLTNSYEWDVVLQGAAETVFFEW